jgi:hypothetical protein
MNKRLIVISRVGEKYGGHADSLSPAASGYSQPNRQRSNPGVKIPIILAAFCANGIRAIYGNV